MFVFTPSRNAGDAERALETLVKPRLDPQLFAKRIQRLQSMFSVCKAYCPPPWASRNLCITPEINYQSERWLPFEELRAHYYYLYRQALTYLPVLSSTTFVQETRWTDVVAAFPDFLDHCENPAALLELLVCDDNLRMKFLFWSFMPQRFYGSGSSRYPGQTITISKWLQQKQRRKKHLRILDAASGDGENTYGIARLLAEAGWQPDKFEVEGWTLEPLEAWSAAHGRFPHNSAREKVFREETMVSMELGLDTVIRFCSVNILDTPNVEPFDLILCNGLLGGPIIHTRCEMDAIIHNLTKLLVPGGMLLAADHFHGGWKQKYPQQELRALFVNNGLKVIEATEGVAALAPAG